VVLLPDKCTFLQKLKTGVVTTNQMAESDACAKNGNLVKLKIAYAGGYCILPWGGTTRGAACGHCHG